jgi:hypothetical protein
MRCEDLGQSIGQVSQALEERRERPMQESARIGKDSL